jgi:hypothetical protein
VGLEDRASPRSVKGSSSLASRTHLGIESESRRRNGNRTHLSLVIGVAGGSRVGGPGGPQRGKGTTVRSLRDERADVGARADMDLSLPRSVILIRDEVTPRQRLMYSFPSTSRT